KKSEAEEALTCNDANEASPTEPMNDDYNRVDRVSQNMVQPSEREASEPWGRPTDNQHPEGMNSDVGVEAMRRSGGAEGKSTDIDQNIEDSHPRRKSEDAA